MEEVIIFERLDFDYVSEKDAFQRTFSKIACTMARL
jgi:hypothetical protein